MKDKIKKILKIILVVLGVILILAIIFINKFKPESYELVDVEPLLAEVDDGSYIGVCKNGIVEVEVSVEVENHIITDIEIVKHQNGMGGDAESIIDEVIKQQSIDVDMVSGATYSSQTILKAIENALTIKE